MCFPSSLQTTRCEWPVLHGSVRFAMAPGGGCGGGAAGLAAGAAVAGNASATRAPGPLGGAGITAS